ncbi:hypothetical protein HanRHA438_Chr07g0302811 [Helianthus annuus]|nr:hypothetical protein HanRHA438_Chr07g0302811 [Helianthus annuus]
MAHDIFVSTLEPNFTDFLIMCWVTINPALFRNVNTKYKKKIIKNMYTFYSF